jgi:hypothetical protein
VPVQSLFQAFAIVGLLPSHGVLARTHRIPRDWSHGAAHALELTQAPRASPRSEIPQKDVILLGVAIDLTGELRFGPSSPAADVTDQ